MPRFVKVSSRHGGLVVDKGQVLVLFIHMLQCRPENIGVVHRCLETTYLGGGVPEQGTQHCVPCEISLQRLFCTSQRQTKLVASVSVLRVAVAVTMIVSF